MAARHAAPPGTQSEGRAVSRAREPKHTTFRFREAEQGCAGGHVQFTVHVGEPSTTLALAGRLTMTRVEAEHFRQLVDGAYDPDGEWRCERPER